MFNRYVLASRGRSRVFKVIMALVVMLGLFGIVLAACARQPSQPGAPPAQSTKPSEQFPNQPITFIVPYTVGGGYDTAARALAPAISAALPNKVPVVVKNVTGGGGVVGVNTLYSSSPDGYTIGVMSSGVAIPQLIGKAQYDLNKFNWLGVMMTDYYITAVSPKSPYRSLQDLRKADRVLAGMTGYTTIDGIGALVQGEKMGYKVKPVMHNGSQEAVTAALRGDVDLVTYPFNVLLELCKKGDLIPLWVSTPERSPELPNVPTLRELGYPEVADFLVLRRLVAAPPGVDAERLKILREAFAAALEDKEYQRLVTEQFKASISKVTPEEVASFVKSTFSMLEPYKEAVAKEWK